LTHRDPDDEGYFGDDLYLSMRRMVIVALATADQLFWSEKSARPGGGLLQGNGNLLVGES
jgi:hypothetical protein